MSQVTRTTLNRTGNRWRRTLTSRSPLLGIGSRTPIRLRSNLRFSGVDTADTAGKTKTIYTESPTKRLEKATLSLLSERLALPPNREAIGNIANALPSNKVEAKTARSHVNNGFYQSVYDSLSESQKELIISLLKRNQNDVRSGWHRLKQEAKQATTKNMREFIQHLHWLFHRLDPRPVNCRPEQYPSTAQPPRSA